MTRTGRHFEAPDPDFAERIRASFALQQAMAFIGTQLAVVKPGRCEVRLPDKPDLSQQHGFFHGGIMGMIADS